VAQGLDRDRRRRSIRHLAQAGNGLAGNVLSQALYALGRIERTLFYLARVIRG
jgi:hypothetical protein